MSYSELTTHYETFSLINKGHKKLHLTLESLNYMILISSLQSHPLWVSLYQLK